MDTIAQADIERSDRMFAKAVFAGGLPFSLFESNPYFEAALRILRPAYPGPPSAFRLKSSLLNAEFDEATTSVKGEMKECISVASREKMTRGGQRIPPIFSLVLR